MLWQLLIVHLSMSEPFFFSGQKVRRVKLSAQPSLSIQLEALSCLCGLEIKSECSHGPFRREWLHGLRPSAGD